MCHNLSKVKELRLNYLDLLVSEQSPLLILLQLPWLPFRINTAHSTVSTLIQTGASGAFMSDPAAFCLTLHLCHFPHWHIWAQYVLHLNIQNNSHIYLVIWMCQELRVLFLFCTVLQQNTKEAVILKYMTAYAQFVFCGQ